MGIDNDEVFCRVSSPPLSSVDVNALAVGYKRLRLEPDSPPFSIWQISFEKESA